MITKKLIGIISDTHGLVRPQALEALKDVDMILHAGDIGSQDVLGTLNEIAPVVAVRGNNDKADWARSLPDWEVVEVAGISRDRLRKPRRRARPEWRLEVATLANYIHLYIIVKGATNCFPTDWLRAGATVMKVGGRYGCYSEPKSIEGVS